MLLVSFGLAIFVSASNLFAGDFPSEKVDLKKLTPEQQAGQLLLFGIHETQMSKELRSFLNQTEPGGYVFFKRNIPDLPSFQSLITELKKVSSLSPQRPPFFAIDEEGGRVSRLPFSPRVPSAAAIGQSRQPELARTVGVEVGLAMSQLGLNLNLAPVLDLGGQNNFLKSRTFSRSSQWVSKFGVEFSQGLLSQGVLPCAKHFPGMATSTSDPHFQVSKGYFKKNKDFEESLFPFRAFAESAPHGVVMMSHLIYPQLDSIAPAVYSPKIYRLLRNQLRFNGLIVTDDLQMDGIKGANQKSFKENVFKALLAGADVVMITWSRKAQREAHAYLVQMIRSGKFPEKQLNEKLERIQKAKEWIHLNQAALSDFRRVASESSPQQKKEINSDLIQVSTDKISSQELLQVWRKIRPQSQKLNKL